MLRGSILSTVVCFLLVSSSFPQTPGDEIIPAGTLLQCTISEPNFSSKTAAVGDPVLCHLNSLAAFGHSVFPRGAELSGHLQDYKNPGHFVGKGWMDIEFDRLILPKGQILPLSAKVISAPRLRTDKEGKLHGKGHPKRDAIEWMIPIFWPVKILTLPARGPYPKLKGETRVSLRLMEDVEIQPSQAVIAAPARTQTDANGYHDSSFRPFSRSSDDYPERRLVTKPTIHVGSSFWRDTEGVPVHPPTIIVLKDGSAYVAREYWTDGWRMHCINDNHEERLVALERIDLSQTTRLNGERHVQFVLRSKGND
ncbi:MAG TPA: hypothetical protein VGS27_11170 [Candidatus Sulfotelmatobacter sp.]|nr:hypothetical protein [Candidatus Sulfotelmatobacter sp.]